jgi:hypothetical protein
VLSCRAPAGKEMKMARKHFRAIFYNSTLERFARRVKKRGKGDMKKRWLASAILQSEESMHRVTGLMGIRALVKNMENVRRSKIEN